MKLEILSTENISAFKDYCRRHRNDVDDSFLYEEDFAEFQVDGDNPTCVVTDQQGRIVAAASLILNEYHRRGRKGRFRIFHSEVEEREYYDMLFQAILKYPRDIDYVFVFVPMVNKKAMEIIKALNFEIERYAFYMVRSVPEVPDFSFPEGYRLKAYEPGDEETWCLVRNARFCKA